MLRRGRAADLNLVRRLRFMGGQVGSRRLDRAMLWLACGFGVECCMLGRVSKPTACVGLVSYSDGGSGGPRFPKP
jgi:hypothetical protein